VLGQQLVNALVLGSEYALIAIGFTLYFGMLNLINLSHGAVYMVGAFAALSIYRVGSAHGVPSIVLLVATAAGAVAVSSALGALIERVAV
jgi:branched-chain amino acid transport system permease protein